MCLTVECASDGQRRTGRPGVFSMEQKQNTQQLRKKVLCVSKGFSFCYALLAWPSQQQQNHHQGYGDGNKLFSTLWWLLERNDHKDTKLHQARLSHVSDLHSCSKVRDERSNT